MVLKRLTILCIGLILTTLLIASNAFCGTDDSGLQVYTLNFGEMMGETADVGQEDTKISPYCYNMFTDGNGLVTLPEPNGYGTEFLGKATDIITPNDSTGYVFIRNAVATSDEVYMHSIPNYPSGTRTLLTTDAVPMSTADMVAFPTRNACYLFMGSSKLLKVTGAVNSPSTTEINLPSTGTTATLWQNRLFFASGSTIYYSAAQDFENFTNSATAGGTTNVFECYQILKLIGTKYGLYIFTDNGIFLQSGLGKTSWSIDRISNLRLVNKRFITNYNDTIFFGVSASVGLKIFTVSGASITEFCEYPTAAYNDVLSDLQIVDSGRFLVFFNTTIGGTSWTYDILKKCFVRSSEYNCGGNERYYIKRTTNGYKAYEFPKMQSINNTFSFALNAYLKTIYPWAYQTAWMTLDGNASNRKEIDRIEVDYLGGTSSIFLYYAYGNGSGSNDFVSVTAPINTRLSTFVWNAPIDKQQSNRFFLYFASSGAQTMTQNYVLKQTRIYYRNIGNYKTNTLR